MILWIQYTHRHSMRRDSYLHSWKVPPSKAEWVNSPQGRAAWVELPPEACQHLS